MVNCFNNRNLNGIIVLIVHSQQSEINGKFDTKNQGLSIIKGGQVLKTLDLK